MRIALALHAFPPHSTTGVEVYAESLARALVEVGLAVEVFAPRPDRAHPALTQSREARAGFGITWVALDAEEEVEERRRCVPGMSDAFARFLEREQPDVVHFQHCLRIGTELVDVARERGLPTLFTAHDHFALCNEYTLLAPDLTRIDPLDFEAQARCRLARGAMDDALDAHDGFLTPGSTTDELRERVQQILRGDAQQAEEVARSARQLRAEMELRLEAVSRVEYIEAPTRYLAQQFERVGLAREICVRPLGIDSAALAENEKAQAASDKRLRVLYIGGYYEHKGVHVLLEACRGLGSQVQLTLRGCSGTSGYFDVLREQAAAASAELGGPFERAELPRLLAESDVVVVPSLWSENAPFVIREAFASGLPVLASDTSALRESVRHGEDGWLFPMGDASALRDLLSTLARDRSRLAELRRGVQAPLSIQEDAAQLIEIYERLHQGARATSARRRTHLPAHLHDFAQRFDELSHLSTRELFERASARLQLEFGADLASAPSLAALRALDVLENAGEGLRERLAEARRTSDWRRAVSEDQEQRVRALELRLQQAQASQTDERKRADWLQRSLGEREAELRWKSQCLAAQEASGAALRAQLEDAQAGRKEFEQRSKASEQALRSIASERDEQAAARAEVERVATWRQTQLQEREKELDWLKTLRADSAAHIAELQAQLAAEQDAAAHRARASEHTLGDSTARSAALQHELAALAEQFALQSAAYAALLEEREAARVHQNYIEGVATASDERNTALSAEVARLRREFQELRGEMRRAVEEGSSLRTRTFSAALARRLATWRAQLDAQVPGPEDAT